MSKETVNIYEIKNWEWINWLLERNTSGEYFRFMEYAKEKIKTLPECQRVSFNYHPKKDLRYNSHDRFTFKLEVEKFAKEYGFDEVVYDFDNNTVTITDTYTHAVEETNMVSQFAKAGIKVTII